MVSQFKQHNVIMIYFLLYFIYTHTKVQSNIGLLQVRLNLVKGRIVRTNRTRLQLLSVEIIGNVVGNWFFFFKQQLPISARAHRLQLDEHARPPQKDHLQPDALAQTGDERAHEREARDRGRLKGARRHLARLLYAREHPQRREDHRPVRCQEGFATADVCQWSREQCESAGERHHQGLLAGANACAEEVLDSQADQEQGELEWDEVLELRAVLDGQELTALFFWFHSVLLFCFLFVLFPLCVFRVLSVKWLPLSY